jgi:hypothetical protein
MAASAALPRFASFEQIDVISCDVVEKDLAEIAGSLRKSLKPHTLKTLQKMSVLCLEVVQETKTLIEADDDAMASPRCSQCSMPLDEEACLHKQSELSLSRESTVLPDELEDFEEDDFEDDCDLAETGLWSAGKINLSLVQKSTNEGDSVGFIAQECAIEASMRPRQIFPDMMSKYRYFEDADWQTFDPEFAQLMVQYPLKPILEDPQEMIA